MKFIEALAQNKLKEAKQLLFNRLEEIAAKRLQEIKN